MPTTSTSNSTTKGKGRTRGQLRVYPAPKTHITKHPGLIVKETLALNGVTAYAASQAIGVTPAALTNVINAKAGISPDMALRLGKYFGNGPRLWIDLQVDHDLAVRGAALKAELANIKKLRKP